MKLFHFWLVLVALSYGVVIQPMNPHQLKSPRQVRKDIRAVRREITDFEQRTQQDIIRTQTAHQAQFGICREIEMVALSLTSAYTMGRLIRTGTSGLLKGTRTLTTPVLKNALRETGSMWLWGTGMITACYLITHGILSLEEQLFQKKIEDLHGLREELKNIDTTTFPPRLATLCARVAQDNPETAFRCGVATNKILPAVVWHELNIAKRDPQIALALIRDKLAKI